MKQHVQQLLRKERSANARIQLQCDLSDGASPNGFALPCHPLTPGASSFGLPAMNVLGGALLIRSGHYGSYNPSRSASQSGRSGRPAAAYRRKTSCWISLRVLHHATEENFSVKTELLIAIATDGICTPL
jgi:hypothetical protein